MEALKAEGLVVGMFVTVLSNKDSKDRAGMGDVIQIQGIELPYIVGQWPGFPDEIHTRSWDTRECSFGMIGDDYAEASLGPDWRMLFNIK